MTTNTLIQEFEADTGLKVEREIPLKRATNSSAGHERKLIRDDDTVIGHFSRKGSDMRRYTMGVVEFQESGTRQPAALYCRRTSATLFLISGVS